MTRILLLKTDIEKRARMLLLKRQTDRQRQRRDRQKERMFFRDGHRHRQTDRHTEGKGVPQR